MSGVFAVGFVGLVALFVTNVAVADTNAFDWQTVGAAAYANTCAACHQPDGKGVPGSFPPLVGHAATLLAQSGGRDYLARLVLYGLQGPITVDGKLFNGAMPAWGGALDDAQLAGALDYVLHSWGNDKALPGDFQLFTPADIAADRSTQLAVAEVYALRSKIVAAPPALPEASVPPAFTQEQADRGHAIYRRNCQDCHGVNLNDGEFGGAPLNGQYFVRHWGGGSVAALYGFMRAKMPPDRPGKLNPQTYADLTAFLLAQNGYQPTQAELPPDPEAQSHMALER
jgi:mono/diheme cytochrome c family protein